MIVERHDGLLIGALAVTAALVLHRFYQAVEGKGAHITINLGFRRKPVLVSAASEFLHSCGAPLCSGGYCVVCEAHRSHECNISVKENL